MNQKKEKINRLHLPIAAFEQSFFIFGPRGTGKTTWIKSQLTNNGLYLDLLETSTFLSLQANPSRLESLILGEKKEWVVIDEIQKIPELLNEVHRLIENYNQKFILTGSSARSLRKKGVNLLAGRALQTYMFPFCTQELGSKFSLETAIEYGMLPQATTLARPKAFLQTYIQTYLREEVLQEGLTRNLSQFSRFLEIASFSQGSQLNYTNIAQESNLDRKQVERYFELLEDLLLSKKLYPFTQKAKRKMVSHPKFYFFDVGVFRALRPTGPLDSSAELEGICLESLVFQELNAVNHYFQLDYALYFWRTTQGTEVDFILYGKNSLIAIEVKRTNQIRPQDLKGLKAFKQDYPMAKCYLFYQGKFKEQHNDITAIPIADALKHLPSILDSGSAITS